MSQDLGARVRTAAESSELIRIVSEVNEDGGIRFALGEIPLRKLSGDEISQLEDSGNLAEDWSSVRVAERFDPVRVRRCSFHGEVVLGAFSNSIAVESNTTLRSGVYESTLSNCVIGNDALVHNVRLLSNYVVGSRAVVFNCGSLTSSAKASFGNGNELPVGVETGGREVAVFAEIDVEIASAVAKPTPLISRARRNGSARMS